MRYSINFALISIFTLLSFAAISQTTYTAGLTFGAANSTLKSDLFATEHSRTSYAAGLQFIVPITNKLEFSPQIAFVQKGATANLGIVVPEEKPQMTAYQFNYRAFEAGMVLGYQPVAHVPVRLHGGMFFDANSHRLSDKLEQPLFGGNLEDYNNVIPAEEIHDAFAGIDYGPVVGISASKGRFRAGVHYYHGLQNLYNNIEFADAGFSIQSRSLRFGLTYFLF